MHDYHPLSPEDAEYIRANFVTLEALCRGRVESPRDLRTMIRDHRLPGPTYVLDDATEMYAPDLLALLDEAGSVDRVRGHFFERYRSVAGAACSEDDVMAEWRGYLSGEFGACLKRVTPENMCEKEALVRSLTVLLERPCSADPAWRERLRREVARLDELERPFAPCDRRRFGGPVSRDRLITQPRARFPDVFGIHDP